MYTILHRINLSAKNTPLPPPSSHAINNPLIPKLYMQSSLISLYFDTPFSNLEVKPPPRVIQSLPTAMIPCRNIVDTLF